MELITKIATLMRHSSILLNNLSSSLYNCQNARLCNIWWCFLVSWLKQRIYILCPLWRCRHHKLVLNAGSCYVKTGAMFELAFILVFATFIRLIISKMRHAVTYVVCWGYKPEGREFDFRWGHWIFFNLPNSSSPTMTLGSTLPLIELSTRNLFGGYWRPARKADNLTVICEPIS
jgi:hypothetical protein